MDASGSDRAAEANRLILEAGASGRELSADELRRVLEHVARAGFQVRTLAKASRLGGIVWGGRVLKGNDRLPSAEVHYLRHVVAEQEWPPGTTLAAYLQSIRDVILDPASGVLVSQLQGEWQLTVVRRSGPLRGPAGHEWVMVDYRVSISSWVTAYQLRRGLVEITRSAGRQGLRWLQPPT